MDLRFAPRTMFFTALALAAACSSNPLTPPGNDSGTDAAQPTDGPGADAQSGPDAGDDVQTTPADTGTGRDAGMVTLGHHSYVDPMQHPADPARLIVMGDSISTGTGASMPALSYYSLLSSNQNTTWPAGMAADLAVHFGHAVPVLNVAVGGATTTSMRNTQIPSLRTRLPAPAMGHSIVVITIGGNDLQAVIASGGDPAGAPLNTAADNLRAVVTYLRDTANFPDGTSIYIAAVYDPSDGEGQISVSANRSAMTCFFGLSLPAFIPALDAWRDRYMALGRELHFSVVDALGYFHGHAHNYAHTGNPYYHADDATYWFNDCIHPNDRGHHEMRRIFYEAIDPTYVVTP